eukprot:m.101357 g.101357  ORF g.101357 m.101357 type:complete len:266 (-) comp15163_c1_seq3:1710-2507(-)
MELPFEQRSSEWYNARKKLIVTASQFADAVNLGYGSSRDFLSHVKTRRQEALEDNTTEDEQMHSSRYLLHGVESEPIILEMYQLLTGLKVKAAGLFVCAEDQRLASLVGASPDGIVLDNDAKPVGLVEIKAPAHRLYSSDAPHDIPVGYMCQMQGQMGVTGITTYCDFVTVCFATQELRVQRVYFSPAYWRTLESQLLKFVGAVLHDLEYEAVRATSVHARKSWPTVRVEELSQQLDDGRWQVGADGMPWNWAVLTGSHTPNHSF